MLTELEAVNIMLSAIGESPVSTLATLHPDVLSSKLLLKHARMEVLEPGKWFNTDVKLTLNLDTAGYIPLPSNCLSVDPVDTALDYTKRGGKLYDKVNHTFIFTQAVVADVVIDVPFDELPFVVQNLVLYRAATALQANFVGDERKLQNLAVRLKDAQLAFNKAEIAAQDYNAMNSPTASRLLRGMRTYRRGIL